MKMLWKYLVKFVALIVGFFIMVIAMSFFAIGGTVTYIVSLLRKKK